MQKQKKELTSKSELKNMRELTLDEEVGFLIKRLNELKLTRLEAERDYRLFKMLVDKTKNQKEKSDNNLAGMNKVKGWLDEIDDKTAVIKQMINEKKDAKKETNKK